MLLAEVCSNPFVVDARLGEAEQLIEGFKEEDLKYLLRQYLKRAEVLAAALTAARGTVMGRPSYREEVAEIG